MVADPMWDPRIEKPRMKSCFTIKLGLVNCAIADLCEYYGEGYLITRISVPEPWRGNGYGSQLLNEIITESDEKGIDLLLEVVPAINYRLDKDQLTAWYERHGFVHWKGIMRRKARREQK